jgi:hypothetical protein
LIFVWTVPESPRWLIRKNRLPQAFRAFCRIRNSEMQAARDLFYAYNQIKEEPKAFAGLTLGRRVVELFTVPRLRRASVASAVCVISQQFSGINVMAFYSSTIFHEAGSDTLGTLMASWGYGMTVFIFAFQLSTPWTPGVAGTCLFSPSHSWQFVWPSSGVASRSIRTTLQGFR